MSFMADKTPEQEPSIEEILASIRQIISDDDEKDQSASAEEAPAPQPVVTPEPKVAEPAPIKTETPVVEPEEEPEPEEEEFIEEEDEDVLELTTADAIGAQPVVRPLEAPIEVDLQDIEETPEEEPPAMSPLPSDTDSILSDETRHAAISSMAKLAGNTPINRPTHSAGSVTLEDIVREILNPMLREWMDTNLPPMVERIVQKELEKLARYALDE